MSNNNIEHIPLIQEEDLNLGSFNNEQSFDSMVSTLSAPTINLTKEVRRKRTMNSFRQKVSADLNSVDVSVNRSIIVENNGEQLSPKEQLDVLASYQTANIERNAQRIVENIKRFLSQPCDVETRYIPASEDADTRAKEWLKVSLYHGLCGIGNRFFVNEKSYSVLQSSENYKFSGHEASDVINGASSINLQGNNANNLADINTRNIGSIIDPQLLQQWMRFVIQELEISILFGEISILGITVRKWINRNSVNVEAITSSLDDIDLGI